MSEERELDYIIKAGLRRMDEAVEGVIAKYARLIDCETTARLDREAIARLKADYTGRYGYEQHRHTQEMAAMIERAAMAPAETWNRCGSVSDYGPALKGARGSIFG